MKNLSTLFAAVLFTLSASSQNFFEENFDACTLPAGWTNTAVVGDTAWTIGDNAEGSPVGSVDGSCMAFVHDDDLGSSYPAVIMDLVSPVLDLSALDTAQLQFDYIFEDIGDSYFAVALWNGSDWDTVFTESTDPGCLGFFPTCTPRSASINIAGYLIADFQMKFIYNDGDTWAWFIGLDNIVIYVPPTDDGQLVEALSPVSGCGLSATEQVSFSVYNNGQDTIQSVTLTYSVDGNTPVAETFSMQIFSADTDTVNMTVPLDLSTVGNYTIQAWLDVPNDADATNDTIVFTIENIPVISGLPYTQDFESGAGGWTAGGVASSWELGDPQGVFIDTANSGINAWVTNLTGDYSDNEFSYIESPCMDFSALLVDPVLEFAHIFNTESCCDEGFVDISTDAGLTWTRLGAAGEGTNWYNDTFNDWWDGTSGDITVWRTATHLLDGAAGESSVKIRFVFSSDGSIADEGFGVDDISIIEQPSINAGVIEILSPLSGCGLGVELVTVVVENFGDADIVGFEVEYDAGSGTVSETFTDTLFAASTDTFTFSATVDLSAFGSYDLGAWTAVAGDGDLTNDSLFWQVSNVPVISGLPYTQDFENGPGGWYSTGEAGIWELGDPEGILIDTANSGVNAWATNLDSVNYNNNQLSYLISPCMDFSALTIDPVLEFALISNAETGWDGMWLESSTDAGATWTIVGNFGEGINWYNNEDEHGANGDDDWWDGDTDGWVMAEHLLDGVAGSANVILRFVFDSDGIITQEGFGVDDISITEQPAINAELSLIVLPLSSCNMTATETVAVFVTNLGSTDMDSIMVSYTLNNGPVVTEVFNQTLLPTESAVLGFSVTADLSVPGDHDLTVWVTTIGDGDTSNDTATTVITSIPTVATFPYSEGFETGTGGWSASGTNSTWELGSPQGTFINAANNGTNAWVTALSAPYNNNELSFLESPCLNLSSVTEDPVLSFAHIFQAEACCDESWIDVSIDGGTTWTKLGAFGEGENWYNDGFNDWWDGTSGDATVWRNAEHILSGVAGEADVKIRFVFSSDGSITGEGFGVDDINIFAQPQLDLVALSFNGPADDCALDQEQVSFTFWNKGLQIVSGFEVGFIVDNGTAQTETFTGSVANGDTVSYTFTTELADLSAAGAHVIDVFTALSGDEMTASDTLWGSVVINHGNNTPLSQTETPDAIISSSILEGTTSQMFFCGLPETLDGCLKIVNVTIDSIQHSWLSDMVISLISPEGDTVLLSANNGGMADDMSDVIFTDDSSYDITLQTDDILPGTYAPQDSLGFYQLYDGQNPNGGWSLFIEDVFGGDDGVLVSWSMTFENNIPTPELAYSDTTICVTQVLDVEVVGNYDSYLWSTGQNEQQIQLFGDELGEGTYEISLLADLNGCTGESNSFTLTVDACTGISELSGLSIDIYPNPSNGEIVLDIKGESDRLNFAVLDMNGKQIHAETLNKIVGGVRKTIDLKALAKGIYFVQLNNGKAGVTRKLVIQ